MAEYFIAFVDDEKDLTEGYRELFQESYKVKTFDDGASYLKFVSEFEANPFRVTITDFRMGEINGIEMIERAVQMNRACPFILMSGHVDKDIAINAANQNCPVKIIEKPADISELEKLIQLFCEGNSANGKPGPKKTA